jgi:predicted nucleic acid-binding protein
MGSLNPEALPEGATFALDTVVLIYLLERHPRYLSNVRKLFRRIEMGGISAVLSTLVLAELLVPAYRDEDLARSEKIIQLLNHFPNLEIVAPSLEIAAEAARVRAGFGLRTPDAIHAATAMQTGAKGIITNDADFRKLSTVMDVWLLEDQG